MLSRSTTKKGIKKKNRRQFETFPAFTKGKYSHIGTDKSSKQHGKWGIKQHTNVHLKPFSLSLSCTSLHSRVATLVDSF